MACIYLQHRPFPSLVALVDYYIRSQEEDIHLKLMPLMKEQGNRMF